MGGTSQGARKAALTKGLQSGILPEEKDYGQNPYSKVHIPFSENNEEEVPRKIPARTITKSGNPQDNIPRITKSGTSYEGSLMKELRNDIREFYTKTQSYEKVLSELKVKSDESEDPNQKQEYITSMEKLKLKHGIAERRLKQAVREYRKLRQRGEQESQRSKWLLENVAKMSLVESLIAREEYPTEDIDWEIDRAEQQIRMSKGHHLLNPMFKEKLKTLKKLKRQGYTKVKVSGNDYVGVENALSGKDMKAKLLQNFKRETGTSSGFEDWYNDYMKMFKKATKQEKLDAIYNDKKKAQASGTSQGAIKAWKKRKRGGGKDEWKRGDKGTTGIAAAGNFWDLRDKFDSLSPAQKSGVLQDAGYKKSVINGEKMYEWDYMDWKSVLDDIGVDGFKSIQNSIITTMDADDDGKFTDSEGTYPHGIKGKTWADKEKTIQRKEGKLTNRELDNVLPLLSEISRDELNLRLDILELQFIGDRSGELSGTSKDWLNKLDKGGLNRLGKETALNYIYEELFDHKGFKKEYGFTIEDLMNDKVKYPHKVPDDDYEFDDPQDVWDSVMQGIHDGEYFSQSSHYSEYLNGVGWDDEYLQGYDNGKYDY